MTTIETAPVAPEKRAARSNNGMENGAVEITGLQPVRKAVKRAIALDELAFAKKLDDTQQRKAATITKLMRYELDLLTLTKAAGIRSGEDTDGLPPIKRQRSAGPKKPRAPRPSKKAKTAAAPAKSEEEEDGSSSSSDSEDQE